jgi:hypothetical protein
MIVMEHCYGPFAFPGVWSKPPPFGPSVSALAGASVTPVPGSVTPTLDVRCGAITGAGVQATVALAGGPSPGVYAITMTAAVSSGRLVVTIADNLARRFRPRARAAGETLTEREQASSGRSLAIGHP